MNNLSFREMLLNFKDEVVKYAREGAPHVTEKSYKNRLSTCKSCVHLEHLRCTLCGCVVKQNGPQLRALITNGRMKEKIVIQKLASEHNLPLRKVEEAIYFQFKYVADVMRAKKFEAIRLPFLGKFHVRKGRLKYLNERPNNS